VVKGRDAGRGVHLLQDDSLNGLDDLYYLLTAHGPSDSDLHSAEPPLHRRAGPRLQYPCDKDTYLQVSRVLGRLQEPDTESCQGS